MKYCFVIRCGTNVTIEKARCKTDEEMFGFCKNIIGCKNVRIYRPSAFDYTNYLMAIDCNGMEEPMPKLNVIASLLNGYINNREPVVGTAVILKELRDEFVPLSDVDENFINGIIAYEGGLI